MDARKRKQEGSKNTDRFKRLPKDLSGAFYATDLALVLVEKDPPGIVAVLDYKSSRDPTPTFAEVLAYNEFLRRGTPVYIVQGPPVWPFNVWQYLWGNPLPDPPDVLLGLVRGGMSWRELADFERGLRAQYRARRN